MDKGLLNDATSTDDSPTPGYMLSEIARSTVASYAACTQLIEFLNARLRKNNHNVKYKCLMIIKQVCRTGRSDFKKDMGRNLDQVKECLQYKGPPDPLRGDEIYKRVRDAAKDALEAIFDSQMPVTQSSVSGRIQGMGGGQEEVAHRQAQGGGGSMFSNMSFSMGGDAGASYSAQSGENMTVHPGGSQGSYNPGEGGGVHNISGPVTGGPGAYNGGSSSMAGVGNPNFKDPRDELSFMQRMSAAADVAAEKLSSLTSSSKAPTTFTPGGPTGHPDYNMSSNRGPGATTAPGYNPSSGPAVGAWGQPLPNASTQSPAAAAFARGGSANPTTMSSPSFSPPQDSGPVAGAGGMVPDMPSQGSGMGRAGAAASDGQYEQQMIASLCEPGGMKAIPPEEKMSSFMSSAPTLSPELVGESLMDSLNSDSWQSRVKALLVIAALAKGNGCGGHAAWWKESGLEDVQAVAQGDSKASVRTQAVKTLRALGVSVSGGAVSPAASGGSRPVRHAAKEAPSAPAADVSLIDFGDDDAGSAEPTPSSSAVSGGGNILDMFDSPAAAAAGSSNSSSAPVPSQSGGGGGLFDGMMLGVADEAPTRTRRPSVPAPVAAQDPSLQASMFNFLDSMDVYSNDDNTSAASQPDTVSESGFSFMSGGGDSAGETPLSAPPSTGGPLDLSAFESLSVNAPPPPPPAPGAYDLSGLNMSMPVHQQHHQQHHHQQQMQYQGQGYPPQHQGQFHSGQQYGQQQQQRYVPYQQSGMGSSSPQIGVRKMIPESSEAGSGGSGFSFMSGASGKPPSGGGDAFDFVSSEMKKSRR